MATAASPSLTPISQLAGFNSYRFEVCVAYMAKQMGRQLTQMDMVKLHVLADYFHVMATGCPMIGGRLSPEKMGPIAHEALNHVKEAMTKHPVKGLRFEGKVGNKFQFASDGSEPEMEDISPAELAAMDKAVAQWKALGTVAERDEYFHTGKSPLGAAWEKADRLGRKAIDWRDVVKAHAAATGEDVGLVSALIEL